MNDAVYEEGKAAGYLGNARLSNPYAPHRDKESIYAEYASDWESGWQHGRDNRDKPYDYTWRTKR